MSEKTAAIVGSGIVGTAIAHHLVTHGYLVDLFEKGPEYPYPHAQPFAEKTHYRYENPAYRLPRTIRDLEYSGDDRLRAIVGLSVNFGKNLLRVMPQVEIERPTSGAGPRGEIASETYYLMVSSDL